MKFKLPQQKLLARLKISRFISVKSRYLLMLFSIAILCILVIGYTGWFNAYNALTESSYNQLTSIRAARAQQIENFFKDKKAHLRILSGNLMFIEALEEFSAAYDLLTLYQQVPDEKQLNELKSFYAEKFYPKLKANGTKLKALQHFYPKSGTAKYLQYHYIVANPSNIGEKHLLDKAPDQSYYSEVHARFHPPLRLLVEQAALHDLFLIDKERGDIVYSVSKEVDFSTNLLSGPYAQSSLAKAVRTIMKNPELGRVIIQDFKFYDASYGRPATFMAVPVYNKQTYIGIIAIQLPVAQINSIMTRYQQWVQDGLGESGEVYLVGSDFTMRSDSRFLIEDAEGYLETLEKAEVAEESLQRIKSLNTSILNQQIKTVSAHLALVDGKTGHQTIHNEQGVELLSAYAPLNINNLRWIILAEKKLAEVNKPIVTLQYAMITATVILVLITGVLSLIFASRFLKPIDDITQIATQFIAGHKVSIIKIESGDEIGLLKNTVKKLIDHSQQQREKIKAQAQENQALMLNFLPSSVVGKLQACEKKIVSKHPNVAIMFTSLHGFGNVINEMSGETAVKKLNKLFQSFDVLANQHDIERLTIIGDSYIAACGLNKPRLDYAARCTDFAKELFEIVALFNQEEGLELKLHIGISAGEVISGIIGDERYAYSVWGDVVSIASRIRYDAKPNGLRVNQPVYNQLRNTDDFEKCELLSLIGIGNLGIWEYTYRPFMSQQITNAFQSHEP
ncbi:adenylate/guanylate cyclase domain-containing protein [Candidatus Marithioploca araucensis]|uniref:adenylate cyclase n=1 Tax=Candidatus Marithioploca araucensis TaxID=70273 RepID=A0ABT7VQ67_9GAMM|nr:adenylate/guanylate cyclase domain-containing protein [Candidatus Marithioploca araucensis]